MTQLFTNQPVSAALEADLREFVRRKGLSIWLDAEAHYADFVRQLQEHAHALPYKVFAFTGSHLELMLALDGVAGGVDNSGVVIYLPRFIEDTVRPTPMLELYRAGTRYRKGLDTLVQEAAAGRVSANDIDAFIAQKEKTLADADLWLSALTHAEAGGMVAAIKSMTPIAVVESLLAGQRPASADVSAVWMGLEIMLGLTPQWRDAALPAATAGTGDIAWVASSWAMCVEYVRDLTRDPVSPLLLPIKRLPQSVVDAGCMLAAHLRLRDHEKYQRWADEAEGLLADEVLAARAEDLGRIDTFRFEETKVLKAALAALEQGDWKNACAWAEQRLDAKSRTTSFWLQHDLDRKSAWELVQAAAELGRAVADAGPRLVVGKSAGDGLEAALATYVSEGAAVDRAHRQLVQKRVKVRYLQIPEFEELTARLDAILVTWSAWADNWARDFSAACRAHGFLPGRALQQRAIFEDVVRPLTESGVTAYFVVDALRYEMGEELRMRLGELPATTVQLKARLAELPSITEIGMNALAPVERSGRMVSSMKSDDSGMQGFQSGEFRVFDPRTRNKAMQDRVGGASCPWMPLGEVIGRDSVSLKRAIAQAKLVVVHSQEIDNAGESGNGPSVFEDVLHQLVAAWRLLRDAGVRRFVFTSDHGFLLLDEKTATKQIHGRKVDPQRRHVFSQVAADHSGEARVALSDLGYEGVTGYLMFPESTAVFDKGRTPVNFAHGGNSLQERAIPVLTVVHKAPAGGSTVQYHVTAVSAEGVAGLHCISASVQVSQGALDFGATSEIQLALRVPDSPGVMAELRQARGDARTEGNTIVARVGGTFELFFRLTGRIDDRVQVELYHPSALADVTPCTVDARFAVTPARGGAPALTEAEPAKGDPAGTWLDEIDDPGFRQVFAHIEAHGSITEVQMTDVLGNARRVRRFATDFDELAKKAPFVVSIASIGGMKRYVREGTR